uniref:Protein involved in gliding motility 9 Secretion System Type.5A n=1 Tax=Siphoviridae sp. ctYgF8 TaxID=2826378 RepID=A0A8S5NLI0_9CAUD|nr:MAG TPA: Protein involved in gliding motility 9 Secretion System Type.5A [Siphoviridae sp. ctYgF8]
MKKLILAITSAFILAGCAAMNEPSQQQLAAATYPDPMPPSQFEKAIKEWAVDNLVDPDSANIRSVDTTPARKGWIAVCTKIDPSMGNCMTRMFYFGHIFNARINAKNQHGGYTGFQDYAFVVRGDQISYGVETEKISNMKLF